MEKITTNTAILFNSLLETGIRSLIVLNETYPSNYTLTEMTWIDYAIVHTSDFGGPSSIHPDLPYRSGEVLVRRRLVKDALDLMRRLHLVKMDMTGRGMIYSSTDEAYPFVELLNAPYNLKLKTASKWLKEFIATHGIETVRDKIEAQIGKWNIEFLAAESR